MAATGPPAGYRHSHSSQSNVVDSSVEEAVTRVSPPRANVRYILGVRFEKIWIEQCRATRAIKRRFGAKSALDYLIGEKLLAFADAARAHPTFAKELPRLLAGIWQVFNEYEIAGYVASRRPIARKRLRQLLYLR